MASTSSSPSPKSLRRSARKIGTSDSKPLPLAHLVHAAVDRSGSMASMGNAPPEQMRAQMMELKEEAEKTGVQTSMSVITFDSTTEIFMDNVPLEGNNALPEYKDFQSALRPRGTTRFYDTVFEAIEALEKRRDDYLETLPSLVKMLNPTVVCSLLVLTDGADNCSTEHNRSTVAARLTQARANGVNAIFLGANIDAGTEGAALGFAKQATVQMNASYAGASQCMRAVSAGLRQASNGATDLDYNQIISQTPSTGGRSGAAGPGIHSPLAPQGVPPTMPMRPPMPPMPCLRRY